MSRPSFIELIHKFKPYRTGKSRTVDLTLHKSTFSPVFKLELWESDSGTVFLCLGVCCFSEMETIHHWSRARVGQWLTESGFPEYRKLFEDRNIDGAALCGLTEESLQREPLNLTVVSDIQKLVGCIQQLKQQHQHSAVCNGQGPQLLPYKAFEVVEMEDSENSFDSDRELLSKTDDNQNTVYYSRLSSELRKTVLAVAYGALSHFMTSVAIVTAQSRLPDKKRYPPLPDIYLDNFAMIPWAYKVSESVILSLLALLGVILIFHKHR